MSRRKRWVRRVLFGVLLLGVLYGAVLLVLTLVSGHRLERELERARASGAPLTPGDAAPPPVADDENAAVVLVRAFALFSEEPELMWDLDVSFALEEEPWELREEDARVFETWVAENACARALLDEALYRPRCLFRADWSRGLESAALDHVPGLMTATRLLSTSACLDIRAGDVDEALAEARTLFRLGRMTQGQGSAIDLLVGIGLQETALRLARAALESDRPAEETERAWIALLDEARQDRPLKAVHVFERALGNLMFELWRDGELDEALVDGHEESGEGLSGVARLLFANPAAQLDQARFLAEMARITELADRPYGDTRDQWDAWDRSETDRQWYDRLTWIVLHVHARVRRGWEVRQTQVDLARIAFALEDYERREGRLPESLSELNLPGGVDDRFGDGPYVYRPDALGGYLLYSVGLNGVDEDGRDELGEPPGDDLAWRRPTRDP